MTEKTEKNTSSLYGPRSQENVEVYYNQSNTVFSRGSNFAQFNHLSAELKKLDKKVTKRYLLENMFDALLSEFPDASKLSEGNAKIRVDGFLKSLQKG